jgi:hypothetical protein
MKKIVLILGAAAIAALALVPASAQASNCGGWSAYNRVGDYAVVSNVHPEGTMNCASSRYVVNKWLRRSYVRSHWAHLPTRFFDGYVTWHCGRTSRFQWRCTEYTSYTSFRFTGVKY